ncbi:MAG TPA: cation/H(+) antiporter [Holosporales bacterium]|nr:cation/H(+) antiporter [Holosporales bacterium]HBW25321.1 cation/H(+) antiporter [Holosporales bacterium]HCC24636.1 cation/H(+) antiporter [Holosporales bacterium]HCE96057.1 cation/H(+) antiporter [Holosporales bacterium]
MRLLKQKNSCYFTFMHIDSSLTFIAIVITAALAGGIILERLKQPAILGYILAGVLLGPSCVGFIKNQKDVYDFAELGVLMLLFVVGMELSIRNFVKTWTISVGCVALQIVGGLAIAFPLAHFFHWPLNLALLLAFVFALSSTAVAVKMLDTIGELRTGTGRITIGILVAQDLAIVPMILIIRGLQPGAEFHVTLMMVKIIISVGLLTVLVWYLSRKERLRLPFLRQVTGNVDLTPLMGLTFCFGASAVAGLSGLSAAYGAFLAGLVMGNSHERQVFIEKMTPIYSVLIMIFFLSIGLLLDLHFLWQNIGKILMILLFITVGKTALNISILHLLRQPWTLSFLSGVVLGQLGEFSFLLATVGEEVGIVTQYGTNLIVSLTVLSLTLSPIWLAVAKRLHDLAPRRTISLSNLLNLLYGREFNFFQRYYKKIKKENSHRANLPD